MDHAVPRLDRLAAEVGERLALAALAALADLE
jgi:hypothetical protein